MKRGMWSKLRNFKFSCYIIAILCTIPVPYIASSGITAITVLLLMYVSMSVSYNLLAGYLGDLSFGHATFFGIGAYTVALLTHYQVCYFQPVNILFGGILAMGFAAVIGYPFLRLKGLYFAIGTLGLSQIFRVLFKNSDFTLRSHGINIPVPLPYSIHPYYYAIVALTFGIIVAADRIVNSRLGLAFVSIRDDPDAARMVGINVTAYRILGFCISALGVGIVGGFFAYFNSYVHPEGVFSLDISFEMLLMVFFGGAGTILGPIVGAVIVLLVEEIGRAFIRQGYLLLLSLMLMVVFLVMPGGVVGTLTKQTPFINPLAQLRRKRVGSA